MATQPFPPTIPTRMQRYVEIEVVDENTIRIKGKPGGEVLKTVTKSEFDTAIGDLIPSPGNGS